MTQEEADRADRLNRRPMVVELPDGRRVTWRVNRGFDDEQIADLVFTASPPSLPIGMPDAPTGNKDSALARLLSIFPEAKVVKGEPVWVDEIIVEDHSLYED